MTSFVTLLSPCQRGQAFPLDFFVDSILVKLAVILVGLFLLVDGFI
jgi:hypothetical protein